MAVSAIYNVPVRRIMGVSQERQDVNARHAAWWVAYETGRLTTVQLGKIFRRHHTTVVYGKRQAVARREREGEFRRITDKLVERFG
jgi:chromosomal replication initiation ATPase DnaA